MQAAKAHTTAVEEELHEIQQFRLVEELQSVGINVADINKLKEYGLATVGSVLQHPRRELNNIKGFSDAKVEKIIEACRKLDCRGSAFKTGREVKERRRRVLRLSTGASQLDGILGGGIETGSITELFGEFRTGKTQLSHTLCVSCQLSREMGGGQGKAVYLDTEGNFRPERIEQIAERFGLDPEETLDNIVVCRVYTHEEQMEVLRPIAGLLSDVENGPFSLIIVDSIIALFRVEFSGRGDLSERQQKLGQHLSELTRIAEEFNIAVVVINQCMADPGAMSMFGPVIKPVGGHVLAHASTTRVMLKKGKADQRIARIYDSPSMPEAEAIFQITAGGVTDAN